MPKAFSRALTFAAPTLARSMSVAELSLMSIIRLTRLRTESTIPGAVRLESMPLPMCWSVLWIRTSSSSANRPSLIWDRTSTRTGTLKVEAIGNGVSPLTASSRPVSICRSETPTSPSSPAMTFLICFSSRWRPEREGWSRPAAGSAAGENIKAAIARMTEDLVKDREKKDLWSIVNLLFGKCRIERFSASAGAGARPG
jgi:hypothetical protein